MGVDDVDHHLQLLQVLVSSWLVRSSSNLIKMIKFLVATALLALSGCSSAMVCESPKTSVMSYVASDAQVLTHAPFIAQFSLTCKGKPVADLPLYYASKEGGWVQVARSKDGSQYQHGWSVELKNAKPQDFTIELFDEEGYSALKRQEEGSANLNVKPLTTVTIQYAGSYKGPYFSSEIVAVLVSFLVVYFAYTSQTKLLA